MKVLLILTLLALSTSAVQALSCMECPSTCPPAPKCPGGLVLDMCGCCDICAKIAGEQCAGPWDNLGKCDTGLTCDLELKEGQMKFNAIGTCRADQPVGTTLEGDKVTGVCPGREVKCIVQPCSVARCNKHPDAVCSNNYCGSCQAVFTVNNTDVTNDCDEPVRRQPLNKKGCRVNGKPYIDGQRFSDGCNTCTCTNGNAMCTKMACLQMKGCQVGENYYRPGQKYNDGCNDCTCTRRGQVACTKRLCKDAVLTRPTATGRSGKCLANKKYYKRGDTFKDDCNKCKCLSRGRVACTKKLCDENSISNVITNPKFDYQPPATGFMELINSLLQMLRSGSKNQRVSHLPINMPME